MSVTIRPNLMAINTVVVEIMVLVCHVISKDHVTEVYSKMGRSPSRSVNILPSLVGHLTLWVGTHQGKLPSCQFCWP